MDQEYQRAVTRICVETALLLLQHGAESAVVVQMAQRLGVALGIERVCFDGKCRLIDHTF